MAAAPYYLGYLILPSVVIGQQIGGIATFMIVALMFGLVPLIDPLFGRARADTTPESATAAPSSFGHRVATALWLPIQIGLLVWLVIEFANVTPTPLEFAGLVLSMGIAAGAMGIALGHELMHREGWIERLMADALMIMVSYHHFCIEHVHGHHRRLATPEDPATAREGESLYRFFPRVVVTGFLSALELEAARLRRRGKGWFHIRNRVLVGAGATLATHALVLAFAGWQAFVFLLAMGLVAVLLLETVNYIEHYGLMRRSIGADRYEAVTEQHSWDARERLTNWILFNLERHADHHVRASVAFPYLVLREGAPLLPAGYPTLIWVALIPPLWFKIMNPRVEAWRAAQPSLAVASG